METKNVNDLPVSNTKTLRIVLSPKVVRDFAIRTKKSSSLNGTRKTSRRESETSGNSTENNCKKIIRDSEVVDSNGRRPIILLDRLTSNEMQTISTLGYISCTNQTNGY